MTYRSNFYCNYKEISNRKQCNITILLFYDCKLTIFIKSEAATETIFENICSFFSDAPFSGNVTIICQHYFFFKKLNLNHIHFIVLSFSLGFQKTTMGLNQMSSLEKKVMSLFLGHNPILHNLHGHEIYCEELRKEVYSVNFWIYLEMEFLHMTFFLSWTSKMQNVSVQSVECFSTKC